MHSKHSVSLYYYSSSTWFTEVNTLKLKWLIVPQDTTLSSKPRLHIIYIIRHLFIRAWWNTNKSSWRVKVIIHNNTAFVLHLPSEYGEKNIPLLLSRLFQIRKWDWLVPDSTDLSQMVWQCLAKGPLYISISFHLWNVKK